MRGGERFRQARRGKAEVISGEGANDWILTMDDIAGRPVALDASIDIARLVTECRQLARDFEGLADDLAEGLH
jgi:hypothetical protein